MAKVTAPAEFIAKGVVAFQVVEFEIKHFGSVIHCTHDTKILNDGRQLVIGGDGFIPHGFEVA